MQSHLRDDGFAPHCRWVMVQRTISSVRRLLCSPFPLREGGRGDRSAFGEAQRLVQAQAAALGPGRGPRLEPGPGAALRRRRTYPPGPLPLTGRGSRGVVARTISYVVPSPNGNGEQSRRRADETACFTVT